MRDFEDFLWEMNDSYEHHYGKEYTNEQIEWLETLYNEYADEYGDIDWSDKQHDTFWYYYLTEVLDIDEGVVERYIEE